MAKFKLLRCRTRYSLFLIARQPSFPMSPKTSNWTPSRCDSTEDPFFFWGGCHKIWNTRPHKGREICRVWMLTDKWIEHVPRKVLRHTHGFGSLTEYGIGCPQITNHNLGIFYDIARLRPQRTDQMVKLLQRCSQMDGVLLIA